jgi:hypothetical protein
MRSNRLAIITFATASLAFGQFRVPKLSDVKDKLSQKNTTTATQPSTGQAAPAQPAPTDPPSNQVAKNEAPAAAPAKPADEPFKPLPAGSTKGQYQGQGVELTLCSKVAREGQWDVACVTPARTFEYKGSLKNVIGTMRFTPPLTNNSPRFKVMVYKGDRMDEYREVTFNTGGRTAGVAFTMTPGLYTVKIVDQFDADKIFLTDQFVVAPDKVGDRAIDNVKTGIGKLMVCSEIDDNWNCVNESNEWDSRKPFNLYVKLPQVISGEVCGWEIYKQNPDGTDGQFVDDLMQGTQGRASKWATTNGNYLPPGKYTIYSIAWEHRATTGNLNSYFAKTTLTVR